MADMRSQVIRLLHQDEPDYRAGAELGDEAVEYLMEVVVGGDPLLASKATSLAGHIGSESAMAVIRAASSNREPVVRVAAAAAMARIPIRSDRNLQAEADPETEVLDQLLHDDDPGVRRFAERSMRAREIEAATIDPSVPSRELESEA